MKSVLFIHPFLPYPLTSGGHQALFNGIRAVKDNYVIGLAFEGMDTLEMRQSIEEFTQKIPNVNLYPLLHEVPNSSKSNYTLKQKLYIKVSEWCHRWIDRVRVFCGFQIEQPIADKKVESANTIWWKHSVTPEDREWINHIYKITRENHFDIIQIEMPWRISDILVMPKDSKVIYVHHELGFVRRELEISSMHNDPYVEVCRKFCDFNEIAQLNMYDAVVTLSSVDTRKLIDKGVVVPIYNSFATVDSSIVYQNISGDGKRLTFVGSDKHAPNFVGITWFLNACWNKLKSIDNSYSLDIIGEWNDETKREYVEKYPDVHFLGFVEDLGTAIKDSIMIVPITLGSGIRMKILDAINNCVPFVSTTIGAEGIPVTDGEDCFIADDDRLFVDNIIKLKDLYIRQRLAANALNTIRENFSIESLRKNRLQIYERVVS